MFEEAVNRPSRWRVFWPEVDDLAGAREAIQLGSWLAFVTAIVSGTVLLAGLGGRSRIGVVDAVLFGLVGFGLRRGWRVAAVAGLVVQGLAIAGTVAQGRLPGIISLFCMVGMINGVRGTFAIRRLVKAATIGTPGLPGATPLANTPLQSSSGAERNGLL